MKKPNSSMDMTQGSILSLLTAFAIPVLFGNIIQQLYSFTDSILVGRFLGTDALASIGATDSLTYLFIGGTNAVATGFSICTAQAWGRHDMPELRGYTAWIVKYTLILSLACGLLLILLTPGLLTMMQTPDSLKQNSRIYLTILFAGLPCSMGLNSLLSLLRSLGDGKIGFYLLLVSSVSNIGLDCLFLSLFPMGVAGAAIATISAQFLVLCIALHYTGKKYPFLHFSKKDWQTRYAYRISLLKNGLPMGAQVCITALATVIIQVALNQCDTQCITAFTIGTKIQNILSQFFNALGITVATFVGQNYGIRDFKTDSKRHPYKYGPGNYLRYPDGPFSHFLSGSLYPVVWR